MKHVHVHLIRSQQFDSFCERRFLAHRYPDIGVNDVGLVHRFLNALCQGDHSPCFNGDRLRIVHDLVRWPERFRRTDPHIHPNFCTTDQQRVAHVVPSVAYVHEFDSGKISFLLFHRQKVGQDLGWMIQVGQTVPHRYAGVFCKTFDRLMGEATELNAVKHAPEDDGGIAHRFFLPELNVILA